MASATRTHGTHAHGKATPAPTARAARRPGGKGVTASHKAAQKAGARPASPARVAPSAKAKPGARNAREPAKAVAPPAREPAARAKAKTAERTPAAPPKAAAPVARPPTQPPKAAAKTRTTHAEEGHALVSSDEDVLAQLNLEMLRAPREGAKAHTPEPAQKPTGATVAKPAPEKSEPELTPSPETVSKLAESAQVLEGKGQFAKAAAAYARAARMSHEDLNELVQAAQLFEKSAECLEKANRQKHEKIIEAQRVLAGELRKQAEEAKMHEKPGDVLGVSGTALGIGAILAGAGMYAGIITQFVNPLWPVIGGTLIGFYGYRRLKNKQTQMKAITEAQIESIREKVIKKILSVGIKQGIVNQTNDAEKRIADEFAKEKYDQIIVEKQIADLLKKAKIDLKEFDTAVEAFINANEKQIANELAVEIGTLRLEETRQKEAEMQKQAKEKEERIKKISEGITSRIHAIAEGYHADLNKGETARVYNALFLKVNDRRQVIAAKTNPIGEAMIQAIERLSEFVQDEANEKTIAQEIQRVVKERIA